MSAPLRFAALGLLALGIHMAGCLDVDGAVDRFCQANPVTCQDPAPAEDGGGEPDASVDGGDKPDGGTDAGPDGGPLETEPPGWKPVPPMQTRRMGHTATVLNDGRVLVVGGSSNGFSPTRSTELYTLSTNSWSDGGVLTTARMDHTATLLGDGKVVVVGGRGPSGSALSNAEVYDPETRAWTQYESIDLGARASHAAVRLPSGKVLVAGGGTSSSDGLNTSALYDPDSHTWTNAGNLNVGRSALTLTLLDEDMVMAIGGFNQNGAQTTAELYDSSQPDAGWRPLFARMKNGRNGHAATLLPSGEVLVTGSRVGSPGWVISSVERYDWETAAWIPQEDMKHARFVHTATALPSGDVLVTGGYSSTDYTAPRDSAELLRPDGGRELIAPMAAARAYHTATWLDAGGVLIIGGDSDGGVLNTAERYVP
ncbi:kelch repeat-containing protein [Corallococcus sp. Z5C101001]|uniref:Kelch repeat-containing protein n=1 Tax=Corallococcus sp. Z5C101001 TaxID=2596829 RepID=UPI001180A483|nr:kelch repeat-containing protein [Corallococcus sp. Z5C101001]TSC34231.1 galactose oxidase [Corallococcus sp. Z5C101001]